MVIQTAKMNDFLSQLGGNQVITPSGARYPKTIEKSNPINDLNPELLTLLHGAELPEPAGPEDVLLFEADPAGKPLYDYENLNIFAQEEDLLKETGVFCLEDLVRASENEFDINETHIPQ